MATKPRPSTKREFLTTLSEPYVEPEVAIQPYSNPNSTYSIDAQAGQPEFNRASQVSLKNDEQATISLGLQEHDDAVLYYLQNVLRPTVTHNDRQIAVPIIYGSPERWKSVQADGYYRDKNGKTMAPLIMFKRESFEKNRSLGNKLDGNVVHNVQYFEKQYSQRNVYDNFSVLRNQKPQKEYILGVIPDYITINYKLAIFTDYVEQLNSLIEALEFSSDSYWGDPERYQFRAIITTFPTPIVLENGADRVSKSEISVTLQGYIIPNAINVAMAGPNPKSYSVTKTIFKEKLL